MKILKNNDRIRKLCSKMKTRFAIFNLLFFSNFMCGMELPPPADTEVRTWCDDALQKDWQESTKQFIKDYPTDPDAARLIKYLEHFSRDVIAKKHVNGWSKQEVETFLRLRKENYPGAYYEIVIILGPRYDLVHSAECSYYVNHWNKKLFPGIEENIQNTIADIKKEQKLKEEELARLAGQKKSWCIIQ